MRVRSSFATLYVNPETVYIVDNDDGAMSVTNDAENVTEYLYSYYGDKRFFYRDSMSSWDELVHDKGKFKEFKPTALSTQEVRELS